jgi:Flp pilus assembly protein TadB
MHSPSLATRRILNGAGATLLIAAVVGYWWLLMAGVVVLVAAALRRWWRFEVEAHRKETALLADAEYQLLLHSTRRATGDSRHTTNAV